MRRGALHNEQCLISLAKAYTLFETNCSAPVIPANYVSSPNTRGTPEILWSSLFTIFACTGTTSASQCPRTTRLMTVIAPEMMRCTACLEMLEAHQHYRAMQDMAREDDVALSLIHCYWAKWAGNCELRRKKRLNKLPDIATEDKKDKAKGDQCVKVGALGQILWSSPPSSPLEIAIVAFAVCVVIIYGLYWDKPQRAEATTAILRYHQGMPGDVLEGAIRQIKISTCSERQGVRLVLPLLLILTGAWVIEANVPTNTVTTLAAAAFGGIHAPAWDFAFPPATDLTLWRCASIATVAAPLCVCSIHLVIHHLATGLCFSFTLLYIAARPSVLVGMFRTLCFLAPG
ncbi:hypothetical protein V8C26DRAFT_440233 [Trichoderma gracile]